MAERKLQIARMVREGRQGRLPAPKLDEEPGSAGRSLRRPPGDRHLQYVVRAHPLQCALPPARREGEARRLRGGRNAGGVPGHVARREQPQADGDALPQPRQHGRGGIDPRQPHRRRRAAHGLRQDDAGAPHGGRKLRPADHRSFGRADAHRALPRARARLRHRRVQVLRGASRRQHVAGGFRRRRIRHVAQPRPLHDHGHRVDDGEHGRGARHRDGGQRRDPGRRFPPQRARAARRPPRRGIWSAKTSAFRRFSPARRSRTRSA